MAIRTVYVPKTLSPEERELLMSVHKRATEVVSYEDQVEPGDPQSILDFFAARKDPDCFIYVADPLFVQALMLERLTHGTITIDKWETRHVFHYEHNPSVPPHKNLKRITGMSRPEIPITENPDLVRTH